MCGCVCVSVRDLGACRFDGLMAAADLFLPFMEP